jgi:hypothetical protein
VDTGFTRAEGELAKQSGLGEQVSFFIYLGLGFFVNCNDGV